MPDSHRPFSAGDRTLVPLLAARQFIPTWHDRQQLANCSQNPPCGGPDAFDPVVGTFLSIDRATPPTNLEFQNAASGEIVGIFKQEGGTLSGVWAKAEQSVALKLMPGANGGAEGDWTVFLDGQPTTLKVKPVKFSTMTGTVPTPGNPPDVTLLEWDRGRGKQVLGARCGDEHWCWIGMQPNESVVDVTLDCSGHLAANGRCIEPGWADAQNLVTPAASGGSKPGGYARIVPSDKLGTFAKPSDIPNWIDAAYIHVSVSTGYSKVVPAPEGDPVFVNPFRFTLAAGDNILQIKAVETSPGSGTYEDYVMLARIVDTNHQPIDQWWYVLRRHTPNMKVPPLARWKWRPGDEGVWVECAAGCCELGSRVRAEAT